MSDYEKSPEEIRTQAWIKQLNEGFFTAICALSGLIAVGFSVLILAHIEESLPVANFVLTIAIPGFLYGVAIYSASKLAAYVGDGKARRFYLWYNDEDSMLHKYVEVEVDTNE